MQCKLPMQVAIYIFADRCLLILQVYRPARSVNRHDYVAKHRSMGQCDLL